MKYETAIILAHGLNKDKSLDRETRERTNLGINIFRENKTGTLLMSGGHKDLGECYGVSLSEAMKRYAIRQGTLGNLILEEDISLETVGELIFCKIGIIDPRNWKKILIVSHGYHIPRVRTITNIVFGDEYQIEFESIKSDLNFDKEILRLWYAKRGYKGDGKPPKMSKKLIADLSQRYMAIYEKITGEKFVPDKSKNVNMRIQDNFRGII